MWAENALFEIGKGITHHQRDRNVDALYDMRLGAEALVAIVDELIKRAEQ